MPPINSGNSPLIKGFERRKNRYKARNAAIKRWYEFYFIEDFYAEAGQTTLSTPDSRNAVDLGVYILSRNPHIDRIPFSTQDMSQRQLMNKGERYLSGQWRTVDWLFMLRGLPHHQRRLAAMMLMTGWYAQYTALVPDPVTREPVAMADLYDPANVYPEWGGYKGVLSAVDHTFFYSLGALREMARVNGWTAPNLRGDDDQLVQILDHWQTKTNKSKAPDITNAVYVSDQSIEDTPEALWQDPDAWLVLQPETNRKTDSKKGGFEEIPFLVGPAGGLEVSSAYTQKASFLLSKLGQGLLAPIEGVQDAINRQVSTLLQEIEASRLGQSTPVIRSPSGSETLEPDDMGKVQSYRNDVDISYPHAFRPDLSSAQTVMAMLQDLFQRSTFPWTSLGQTSFTLSGVAIERLNESARSHLEPFHYMMRHVYQATAQIWLRDYKRRWGTAPAGRIRLQGSTMAGGQSAGFFDEEFSPQDIPETRYILSEIPWGLVEDDMMKANIAVSLERIMSKTWIRENIVKVQDPILEARRTAEDRVEEAPFWVNSKMVGRLREEMDAQVLAGDQTGAKLTGVIMQTLLQSLSPQQGRGIPAAPGQGSPEAGGNMTNAGGGRPELAPGTRLPENSVPEAPGGPGGQAERNV
jgi:hypothetical protein